jgi:hypothetical protein
LHQQQMNEAYHSAKRKGLDEKWATFFYQVNVPFNVVRHPSFIAALRATSLAQFDYEPPSYHAMRTTFIKPTKKHVETELKKATKQSIEIYIATICMDGSDNVTRRLLMNVMLSCSVRDIFLGSIDMTGNKKTKAYIATELKKLIDNVGPRLVIQICIDNARICLGPWTTLSRHTPTFSNRAALHMLWISCWRIGQNRPIQGLDSQGQACVPLHVDPPCDHGTILGELFEKVFDSTSGDTICLLIPHDKSNA